MVLSVLSELVLQVESDRELTADVTSSGAPAIVPDGDGDKLERLLARTGLPAGNQHQTVFFETDYADPKGVAAGAVYADNGAPDGFIDEPVLT